jgi:hypothetical protein
MDTGKFCAERDDYIDNLCRRSMLRRLWDSIIDDILIVMQWHRQGKCSQAAVSKAIRELVPKLCLLTDDGKLQDDIKRAESVILERVLREVNGRAEQVKGNGEHVSEVN